MLHAVRFATAGGRGEGTGVLARPVGAPRAAVILLHEWWGLNGEIQAFAERCAAEGLLALAIDLYGGHVTEDAAVALELSTELKTADALDAIAGAVAWLHGEHARVTVMGFCLGGAIALAAACNVDGLAAALPFYGTPKDEYLNFARARCPIQGHYGKHDPIVSTARVEMLRDRALRDGATFELHMYDAGHAFMRRSDPQAYDEAAATLAWERAWPLLTGEVTP
jgi:carboxymethylenebutenolidase